MTRTRACLGPATPTTPSDHSRPCPSPRPTSSTGAHTSPIRSWSVGCIVASYSEYPQRQQQWSHRQFVQVVCARSGGYCERGSPEVDSLKDHHPRLLRLLHCCLCVHSKPRSAAHPGRKRSVDGAFCTGHRCRNALRRHKSPPPPSPSPRQPPPPPPTPTTSRTNRSSQSMPATAAQPIRALKHFPIRLPIHALHVLMPHYIH